MKEIRNYSLYLVTSEEYSRDRDTLRVAQKAVAARIDILQMREKWMPYKGLLDLGKKLSALCKKNQVTFIVNDDPFLVKQVNADGIHMGQADIKKYTLEKIRDIIGKNAIIGISTHSVDEVECANDSDVDYVSYGPIFPTKAKNYSIGTKDLEKVLRISNKPVIFIGGITLENIDVLLKRGAKNIAATRAITQAGDIKKEVENLREKLNQYRREKCQKL